MGLYISGDYEATCKIEGKCKITALYIPNKATKNIAVRYDCYRDDCTNLKCAANGGSDNTCFSLDKLINRRV